jgi:glycosyltransferase involved in cell wall biosynthesis
VPIAHRIYVDLQAAQSAAHAERGIARYSIELTRSMLRLGAPIDAIALSPHLPNPRRLPADLATSALLTWRSASSIERVARGGPLAYQVMSPIELELPPLRTFPESAIERADAVVVVLYDLIPLVFEARYLAHPRVREPYLARLGLLRQADLLLAISEHSRRDAIDLLGVDPARVVAIGGGVSEVFSPAPVADDPRGEVERALPSVDRPFVLTVAGWEWRKNTEALIQAFGTIDRSVRDGVQLVIACTVPPEGEAAWRAEAAAAGLRTDEVVITGYVGDELLRSLYRATELFVFPSRYEGFGLPVAEAARCGAAVITSDSSSLPEILGLPESTFPADDVGAMAAAIVRGLTDDQFRARLFAAGERAARVHTWERTAQRALEAYERIDVGRSQLRRRRVRARVAFVGPLPPTESGIAVYNERVLGALDAPDLDLHLIVEGDAHRDIADKLGARMYPVEALDDTLDPHDYDLFVHTIGNSRFHVRSFDVARRHTGVLWLHDAYLIGLHLEWALWQIRSGLRPTDVLTIFREQIGALYGGRIPPETVLIEPLSHQHFVDRGVYLTAGLVRRAEHLIVNSDLARQMARLDLGPDGRLPPTTVLHHAVPERAVGGGVAPTSARRLVVALGVVHAIKRPDVLVEAVASLRPEADLVFVGSCDREARAIVDDAAVRNGVSHRVRVTGHVERAEYERWIDAAHVAVQLRDVSFGESSGAVHDAVAAGVPVVTSILACRDLPPGVVEMVSPDAPASDIAAAIRSVIDDPARSASMRAAGAAFAKDWTFARVADELATVIRRALAARV